MTEQGLIPDEEIEKVHGSANFGYPDKRRVIRLTLMKRACGYWAGATANHICIEHGLITPKTHKLTRKGQEYLWAAFGKGLE